jgi:hypothetical protein
MPDCSVCTCMLVCVSFCASLHARPRVQQAPGIPCSLSSRDKVHANLGRIAPRDRERIFSCHRPRRRTIQYSRDISDEIDKPQRTGYPACAGYDGRAFSSRHRPRRRTIQYSRDISDGIDKPQRTGYPAYSCGFASTPDQRCGGGGPIRHLCKNIKLFRRFPRLLH